MPFNGNLCYDFIRVSLNRQLIIDLLELTFTKVRRVDWTAAEKRYFDCFVSYIEGQYRYYLQEGYNHEKTRKNFNDWFLENDYNEYHKIDRIKNLFIHEKY